MEKNGDIVLKVEDLHAYFHTTLGTVRALNGVSFAVPAGKVLGVVGESGCGKSVTSLAVMQLVPPPGRIEQGKIWFHAARRGGEWIEITQLDRHSEEMHQIRGNEISMIFQEPMTSLNPVFTCGNQIIEVLMLHQKMSKSQAREKTVELLDTVRIPLARQRVDEYPHQLSGGMKQRVMIAMALACNPKLLIADEPTTALDVTIQAQILDLLNDLQGKFNMSILLITHDLGVIAEIAEHVAVMYASKIAEYADVDGLFSDPKHPYTQGLFNSLPKLGVKQKKLNVIPGNVPNPTEFLPGCKFHPRCPHTMDICRETEPKLIEVSPGHTCACHLYPGQDEQ